MDLESNTALALTTVATFGTLALITAPLVFEWLADYLETPEMLKRRAEYHDKCAREARARISPFERLGDLIIENQLRQRRHDDNNVDADRPIE